MTSDFHVDKATVHVRARTIVGQEHDGRVFLAFDPQLDQRERLTHILADRDFVPLDTDSGTIFLRSGALVWLRIPLLSALTELDPEVESSNQSRTASVTVNLEDGSSLTGQVRYFRPRSDQRLGDYLNSAPRFFVLRKQDSVHLISRSRTVNVIPHQEVVE